jgi:egghead protein (zeste-white 4 protein)
MEVLYKCLPDSQWFIEVVTDTAIDLPHFGGKLIELVVPRDYELNSTGTTTLYKARALHYATEVSSAAREDWIVHLDEETSFDEYTVAAILAHVKHESQLVASGSQRYGKMGQGPILYGRKKVENWLTTLADSVRCADDFGKFRTQYFYNEAWIGVHGSFLVVPNSVELDFGFDHGHDASITEDTFFALVCADKGVRFSWIDAFMYEQSPFSIMDFIKQRRRWFGGLWLVCRAPSISLKRRVILGTLIFHWTCCPLAPVASWFHAFVGIHVYGANAQHEPHYMEAWFGVCLGVIGGLYIFNYLLGFSVTFDRKQHGWLKWSLIGLAQGCGVNFFSLMEIAGVAYAVFDPPKKFYVVQKQQGGKFGNECQTDKPIAEKESSQLAGTAMADLPENYEEKGLQSTIEALRGVAVVGVIAMHAHVTNRVQGVLLWFILSGFSAHMSCAKRRTAGEERWWLTFYMKALLRHLPVFWTALLVTAAFVHVYIPNILISWEHIVTVAVFANQYGGWQTSLMQVEWAVALQAGFFLLYPAVASVVRDMSHSMMLLFVSAICSTFVSRLHTEYTLHLTLPSLLPAFLLGTCIAQFQLSIKSSGLLRSKREDTKPYALCGLFLSLYGALTVPNDYSMVLIRAAVWLPLLVGLIWSPCFMVENVFFEFLGKISFSLYLYHALFTHYLVPHMLSQMLPSQHFPDAAQPTFAASLMWFVMALVPSVILASASHYSLGKLGERLARQYSP